MFTGKKEKQKGLGKSSPCPTSHYKNSAVKPVGVNDDTTAMITAVRVKITMINTVAPPVGLNGNAITLTDYWLVTYTLVAKLFVMRFQSH